MHSLSSFSLEFKLLSSKNTWINTYLVYFRCHHWHFTTPMRPYSFWHEFCFPVAVLNSLVFSVSQRWKLCPSATHVQCRNMRKSYHIILADDVSTCTAKYSLGVMKRLKSRWELNLKWRFQLPESFLCHPHDRVHLPHVIENDIIQCLYKIIKS